MKDDIHNTVQVDSNTDKAVLVNLGEVEKTLQGKKGTKVVLILIICLEAWHIDSTHAPLNHDDCNLLADAFSCICDSFYSLYHCKGMKEPP